MEPALKSEESLPFLAISIHILYVSKFTWHIESIFIKYIFIKDAFLFSIYWIQKRFKSVDCFVIFTNGLNYK